MEPLNKQGGKLASRNQISQYGVETNDSFMKKLDPALKAQLSQRDSFVQAYYGCLCKRNPTKEASELFKRATKWENEIYMKAGSETTDKSYTKLAQDLLNRLKTATWEEHNKKEKHKNRPLEQMSVNVNKRKYPQSKNDLGLHACRPSKKKLENKNNLGLPIVKKILEEVIENVISGSEKGATKLKSNDNESVTSAVSNASEYTGFPLKTSSNVTKRISAPLPDMDFFESGSLNQKKEANDAGNKKQIVRGGPTYSSSNFNQLRHLNFPQSPLPSLCDNDNMFQTLQPTKAVSQKSYPDTLELNRKKDRPLKPLEVVPTTPINSFTPRLDEMVIPLSRTLRKTAQNQQLDTGMFNPFNILSPIAYGLPNGFDSFQNSHSSFQGTNFDMDAPGYFSLPSSPVMSHTAASEPKGTTQQSSRFSALNSDKTDWPDTSRSDKSDKNYSSNLPFSNRSINNSHDISKSSKGTKLQQQDPAMKTIRKTGISKSSFPSNEVNKAVSSGPKDEKPSSDFQCRCKKSKCLKKYCDCFAESKFCSPHCKCSDCYNNLEHIEERKTALEKVRAYDSKHQKASGCRCKKTNCIKKYCECFAANVPCTSVCQCSDCKNVTSIEAEDSVKPSSLEYKKKAPPRVQISKMPLSSEVDLITGKPSAKAAPTPTKLIDANFNSSNGLPNFGFDTYLASSPVGPSLFDMNSMFGLPSSRSAFSPH